MDKCMGLYPIVKKTFYCLIPVITIYKYNDSISINAFLSPYTFPQGLLLHHFVENYFIFGVWLTIYKKGFPKSCLLWLSIC